MENFDIDFIYHSSQWPAAFQESMNEDNCLQVDDSVCLADIEKLYQIYKGKCYIDEYYAFL